MTGPEFEELMRSLGHTQTSLAEAWGMSRLTVGRLCRGDKVDQPYADALRYAAIRERIVSVAETVSELSKTPKKRNK